jgi:FkbM family methyltransferase
MKRKIQFILQKIIGFQNYLFIFSIFRIFTLKFKKYERDVFGFINLLKDNSNVFDIGANIGIVTVLLSKKVKNGFVYAFEPIPYNFEVLKKIVKIFRCKNVKLYRLALGDENKNITMVMPRINGVLMRGLCYVERHQCLENIDGLIFKVRQMRLDDMKDMQNVTIDGVKMDVENSEMFILKGSSNILSKNKPIIYCEVWNNCHRPETFELLLNLNYKINVLSDGRLIDYMHEKHHTDNFFFIQQDV